MGSQARVAANRRNAAKSTGPRTTEGKAVVAQNAVKHGLWARQAVLRNEDSQEFELHRSRMLRKLAPDGPEEEAMAERIVGLWWRLKRAERMQDEALDYLLEADRGDGWVKCCRENRDPSARAELAFGRAVARDFAETRTLDRLSMHERRIESSLYRTMKELRQVRREGKAGEEVSSVKCQVSGSDGWQRQAQPAELADGVGLHPDAIGKPALDDATREGTSDSAKQSQFEAPQKDHRQASLDAATHTVVSDCAKQSQSVTVESGHSPPCETDYAKQSQFEEPQEDHRQASLDAATHTVVSDCTKQSQSVTVEGGHCLPCETDRAKQSQSGEVSSLKCEVSREAGPAAEDKPSCETKPIQGGVSSLKCQVSSGGPALDTSRQTPCGVTTNGDGRAKQSQRPTPAAGAGVVLRARPRVAYHNHDVARSY